MKNENTQFNAVDIGRDLEWLANLLDQRIDAEYGNKIHAESDLPELFPAPEFPQFISPYALFIKNNKLRSADRAALMLALAPVVKPQLLDVFFLRNSDHNKQFVEFGGAENKKHKGFIPTAQTLLFMLAGNNLDQRFHYMRLLEADNFLIKQKHLLLDATDSDQPFTSGVLQLSRELIELFTKGEPFKPSFSQAFPAKILNTGMNWTDLVLASQTKNQLKELTWWLAHNQTLMKTWNMEKKLKPGYRALFYGPPGTGKTLTAALIGKLYERDVYRVDLSKIVSKYIGETEKNLAEIFDRAEHKDWILFFDEADSLFSKRTNVQTSNDRHANQEVSYLLQRVEDYNGLVILATNLKTNIDDAFLRRLQSVVYFPMPKKPERFALWKNTLPGKCIQGDDLNLEHVAEKYEVAGGTIINVVQYCALKAIENGTNTITKADITEGIGRELVKMGRTS